MTTFLETTKNCLMMQQPSKSFYRIVYFLQRKMPWNIYTNQFRNVTENKEVKEISRSIIQIRIHSISFPQLFCAILSFFPTLKAKVTMFLLKKLHHHCVCKGKVRKNFRKHVRTTVELTSCWREMMRVTGHQVSLTLLYVLPKSSVKVTNVLLSSNVSFSTSHLGPFCIEVGYLVFVVVLFKCCWQHWGHLQTQAGKESKIQETYSIPSNLATIVKQKDQYFISTLTHTTLYTIWVSFKERFRYWIANASMQQQHAPSRIDFEKGAKGNFKPNIWISKGRNVFKNSFFQNYH